MKQRGWMAAATLLMTVASAHANHYDYAVVLTGTYTVGGTQGCTDFDPTGCPQAGSLSGLLSFDTPSTGDGSWVIAGPFGDITNFQVTLGSLSSDELFGSINVNGSVPNGNVQASDMSEYFAFDWASRTAVYTYDYGYHEANGNFSGVLRAVPETSNAALMLAGLAALLGLRRHTRTAAARTSAT